MRGKVTTLAILVVAALIFLLSRNRQDGDSSGNQVAAKADGQFDPTAAQTATEPARPAKLSVREDSGPRPTHAPHQLVDFFLPPIEIDDLILSAALEKVREAYLSACEVSGERPLNLVFSIPPQVDHRINRKLPGRRMDGSIRLLGSLCGLEVRRRGSEYIFEVPADLGTPVEKKIPVPPDFLTRLANGASELDTRSLLAIAGLDLDPSTSVRFNPADSTLTLGTSSSSDLVAVQGLASSFGEPPTLQKLNAKVIELPADSPWNQETLGQLDDAGLQGLMRDLSQAEGVSLRAVPSVTSLNGDEAKVEVIREVIFPSSERPDEFETRNVGLEMAVQPTALAFGHQLKVNLTDTRVVEMQPTPRFEERSRFEAESYSDDGASRILEQVRPDGTRALLVVTPQLIDATGRPVNGP
ncbi:hypothetical protein HAHE_11560 [Haloferula helveola]|uniref:Uncharacterized protein n=1 Tax=Haloferula helveola TaxID=490095 RepID=A0ABM7R8B6_9BACT|nr:hypothetical protein HAHE_11560 [Haloferula helveola]